MSAPTSIEWTDYSWNPVSGCTKVSRGCDHCYAETIATRFAGTPAYPNGFQVTLKPDRLLDPLRKRSWRGKRVFVNSMSDLFHKDVPDDYIAKVWAVMALTPEVTYQVLTKRHGRMRSLLSSDRFAAAVEDAADLLNNQHATRLPDPMPWPLPNVWLGVSVEDQSAADLRIPALLDTPAAVRFLSCEPLLGPVDLGMKVGCPDGGHCGRRCTGGECWRVGMCLPLSMYGENWTADDLRRETGIDWVIAGGESGPGARPMHPDWARSLRDQCAAAGVPFSFKQWGEWVPEGMWLHRDTSPAGYLSPDGMFRPLVDGVPDAAPFARGDVMTMRRVGNKAAGRLLGGRTHDEFPGGAR